MNLKFGIYRFYIEFWFACYGCDSGLQFGIEMCHWNASFILGLLRGPEIRWFLGNRELTDKRKCCGNVWIFRKPIAQFTRSSDGAIIRQWPTNKIFPVR